MLALDGDPFMFMTSRIRIGPAALLVSLVVALVFSCCRVPAAQAAYMVPGSPWRPKDFAFFKKDGLYHLFYIRTNMQLPQPLTEVDFGHATSPDLYYWTQQHIPFSVNPAGWDNEHVWAPHIIEYGGLYWMFYTGVTLAPGYNHTQRTGLAYSSNLDDWQRLPGPVFSGSNVPWAWWNPPNAAVGFRDPFVMPDPTSPGYWLMYYTAYPASDTTGSLIGVANASDDLEQWSDLKPLWITHKSYTYNVLTESPHLLQHNGLWYLFVTTGFAQPLTLYTSPDPTSDPAGWTYRGRLSTMLGYDTSFWYASEAMSDGLRDFFAFVSGDRIDIREMRWSSTGWQFYLVQPPLMHIKSMEWESVSAAEGSTINLKVGAVNVFSGIQPVEGVIDDPTLGVIVAPADSLGFPSPMPLTGDTTLVAWVARRWPATTSPTATTRIRIRTTDQRVESPWLTIGPPNPGSPPGGPDEPPEDLGLNKTIRPVRLPSFAGRDQGLRVELDQPAHVRIDMFDVTGRRVRTLADRELPLGTTLVTWDRRDEAGSRVLPGVYFASVRGDGVAGSTRVIVTDR